VREKEEEPEKRDPQNRVPQPLGADREPSAPSPREPLAPATNILQPFAPDDSEETDAENEKGDAEHEKATA
jgi:hypothetical protein